MSCNYRHSATRRRSRITCCRPRISFYDTHHNIYPESTSTPGPVCKTITVDVIFIVCENRKVTYRLTDNVTHFTLCFNYGIAICVESTDSFYAYIFRWPHFINLFQYLLSGNRCDALVWWWTFCLKREEILIDFGELASLD
jgi:hypothetical protein